MSYLDRIDRVFRPFAIPNLTNILVFGQAAMYLMSLNDPTIAPRATLLWSEVMAGEVWRPLTFMFVPPSAGVFSLFVIFYFWIFHMIGNSIEQSWGSVRYTAYLLIGVLLTILASVLNPLVPIDGLFLELTVFLAFATYNPNYEFLMFFVLPVKVKYLAVLQAAGYLFLIAFSAGAMRLIPLAALANYIIFFAPTLINNLANSRRRIKAQTRAATMTGQGEKPRHICATCGIDSRTHPKMQFRYCSKCEGGKAYCEAHLQDHDHV